VAFVNNGSQSIDFEGFGSSAVAVRPGDVAVAVPEPQTLALALSALSALLALFSLVSLFSLLALSALGATMVVRRRRPVRRFDAPGALQPARSKPSPPLKASVRSAMPTLCEARAGG